MATHKRLLGLSTKLPFSVTGAIVEVGSQRSPGKGSSYELKALADEMSTNFYTVDLSKISYKAAESAVGKCAFNEDGAAFLEHFKEEIFLLYLDNYDIIYSDAHALDIASRMADVSVELGYSFEDATQQNSRSMLMHLAQAQAALPKLSEKCIVGLDDTLLRDGIWWGKGALAAPFLMHNGFKIIEIDKKGLILSRNLDLEL